ncbi:Protein CURLY FLAG LEAF 1 [Cardamine amara subsp. amara]|uniref:Protein CURLY FLAG LEAF 1 n=1 Tax=Cardamine amara subsp. amara TaxID=228776 RepID=A0ABD1AHT6_CARAN
MKAPNMETITESMQNCSLNDRRRRVGDEFGRSSTTDEHTPISDRTLELNSHISLPCHWEQCLDLKTGEIYYINWKNGMKVKEDPRKVMNAADHDSGESYGTVCSEEDSSFYDSEESSSESSPSSRENHKEEDEDEEEEEEEDVLVVAGCKACFMYFMVPKLVEDCPKCAAQLLHFDRPYSA